MINNMDMEYKSGKMGQITRETIDSEKSMERESLPGQMVLNFKATFYKMAYKAKEFINGRMEEHTQANGKITKCMALVYLNGLTVEIIKEIILKMRNKVMEYLSGLMGEGMKEHGTKAFKMEKELW